MGLQMFTHLQELKASSCVMAAWENKRSFELSPFLLLPHSSYCWAWHRVVWNMPWVSRHQLSWLCPLPAPHPSPASWLWDKGRSRKGLDSVEAVPSSSKNIPELPTLLPELIQSTNPYRILWRKFTPLQAKPVQWKWKENSDQLLDWQPGEVREENKWNHI